MKVGVSSTDTEAVLLNPQNESASVVYYKTNLSIQNFTLNYNSKTGSAFRYVRDKTEAECQKHRLKKNVK